MTSRDGSAPASVGGRTRTDKLPSGERPLARSSASVAQAHDANATIESMMAALMFWWANVDVLPPGQGRAVGVDAVELLPVGSDDLLDFFISLGRCGDTTGPKLQKLNSPNRHHQPNRPIHRSAQK